MRITPLAHTPRGPWLSGLGLPLLEKPRALHRPNEPIIKEKTPVAQFMMGPCLGLPAAGRRPANPPNLLIAPDLSSLLLSSPLPLPSSSSLSPSPSLFNPLSCPALFLSHPSSRPLAIFNITSPLPPPPLSRPLSLSLAHLVSRRRRCKIFIASDGHAARRARERERARESETAREREESARTLERCRARTLELELKLELQLEPDRAKEHQTENLKGKKLARERKTQSKEGGGGGGWPARAHGLPAVSSAHRVPDAR